MAGNRISQIMNCIIFCNEGEKRRESDREKGRDEREMGKRGGGREEEEVGRRGDEEGKEKGNKEG
jgi:hypothetical protein